MRRRECEGMRCWLNRNGNGNGARGVGDCRGEGGGGETGGDDFKV